MPQPAAESIVARYSLSAIAGHAASPPPRIQNASSSTLGREAHSRFHPTSVPHLNPFLNGRGRWGAALDGDNGPNRNDLLCVNGRLKSALHIFCHSLTGGFQRLRYGEGSQSVTFFLCRALADYSSRSTCCVFNSVGDTGLEPATSRMSTVCSNQTELTARSDDYYTHLANLVNWWIGNWYGNW